MSEQVGKEFYRRIGRYMLVITAVSIIPPGIAFMFLMDGPGRLVHLYNIPGSLGIGFGLSWAIAYHRQFRYPEAFGVLKTGAFWTGLGTGAGLALKFAMQGFEFGLSGLEMMFAVILAMGFCMLISPLLVGFWLYVLLKIWPRP